MHCFGDISDLVQFFLGSMGCFSSLVWTCSLLAQSFTLFLVSDFPSILNLAYPHYDIGFYL
ncbi:hypothetical protein BU26DRAFT_150008 [Trematosphaeria pertusa]|uniref:Uncharacterized protein n=1 Tax=Trematosphaeria pertusa TaxID=390896 RepID=A0A6A6IYC2_9PLEO|nr:uncharacterized protein BU26DRAFT_150008 [Trematosphaeria pertusa]KAF2255037.1 hypothetical protein BU26DRAFT_150008 [Trematosphaeria pertusa]